MQHELRFTNESDAWKQIMFLYSSALSIMNARLDVLTEEFRLTNRYNPIEHIQSRVKTAESIVKKLHRHGRDVTVENMIQTVNDIAGIRIVCSFVPDIYRIASIIESLPDITVLNTKDYLRSPKENGYRSFHMIVTVPVYLSNHREDVKVEIQIRTIAMDFWASLEHKIYYKFEGNAPETLWGELRDCAELAASLDQRMDQMNRIIAQTSAPEVKPETTLRLLEEIGKLAT